jgi:hypothetical protein
MVRHFLTVENSLIEVIADTHGLFDPAIRGHLKGVDHILRAGNIGNQSVIEQLEQIVAVIAAQSFPVMRHMCTVAYGGLDRASV